MALHFESLDPTVQERLKARNPAVFSTPATGPEEAPFAAPTGSARPPRPMGGPMPAPARGPGAPMLGPLAGARPYTDVAADAAAERERTNARMAYQARAQKEGRGGPAPSPLHPVQFPGPPLRHQISMIGATTNALRRLHRGGSLGDLLEFASGQHLEPVYRRMEREEHMADIENRLRMSNRGARPRGF